MPAFLRPSSTSTGNGRGSNARSTEGSGLGLALVNRSVSLHGGQIDVRSRQDGPRGTVFTVRLPEAKS